MVAVIVLYDHVHPLGAFVKSSGIDVSINKVQTILLTTGQFRRGVNTIGPHIKLCPINVFTNLIEFYQSII